jgi:hypothetical protein
LNPVVVEVILKGLGFADLPPTKRENMTEIPSRDRTIESDPCVNAAFVKWVGEGIPDNTFRSSAGPDPVRLAKASRKNSQRDSSCSAVQGARYCPRIAAS